MWSNQFYWHPASFLHNGHRLLQPPCTLLLGFLLLIFFAKQRLCSACTQRLRSAGLCIGLTLHVILLKNMPGSLLAV